MKPLCQFFVFGCISLASTALAGIAAFLPGEFKIVRVDDEGLRAFDPATGSEVAFDPPVVKDQRGHHKLTASQTQLFASSGSKVLAWSPQERKWVEWWTAPEQAAVADLAFDHKHDRLLVLTAGEEQLHWWLVTEEDKTGRNVFNRRAGDAFQPVFDTSGSIFFTMRGDIWKGTIDTNDDDENEDEPFHWLEAQRLWPVAFQETSDGTPGSTGAREIVPLEKHLVLELSRYGGSGWGDIIRLPHEDPYENHLPLKWQELEECFQGSSSALSPDGKHAAIHINHLGKWFEIDVETGDMKPFAK